MRVPFLFFSLLLIGCQENYAPCGHHDSLDWKGMTIFFHRDRNLYDEEDFLQNLIEIERAGCNAVILVPYGFLKDRRSHAVRFSDPPTISDLDFRAACRRVVESGFKLGVKPHLDLESHEPRSTLDPDDRVLWRQSYLDFLLHYANLAEEEGAALFCVGTELGALSSDTDLWRGIIEAARGVFAGRLTYAPMPQEALSIKFWDRLDFIGINAYFPVSGRDDPALEDLLLSWGAWVQWMRDLSHEWGRPILITEIGYRSVKGATDAPGDYWTQAALDGELQSNCYRAALMAAERNPSLAGLCWWQWELNGRGGSMNHDYTPRGKEAEAVLEEFWRCR